MKNPLQFTLVLGIAAAGMALAAQSEKPPAKNSDAPAAQQTNRKKASHRPVQDQNSEANRSSADRAAPESSNSESSKSDAAAIREAIRFEHFKDAAAARQMRLDAQRKQ
jgi:hypothetical protein